MIPKQGSYLVWTGCIPRESGDDPGRGVYQLQLAEYSPRERG